MLCAGPRYVELVGAPQEPADLNAHQQFGFREPASGRLMAWQFASPADGSALRHVPRPRIVDDDLSAVWSMMINGPVLAWVPAWLGIAALNDGRAVELMRDWQKAELPSSAVRLERQHTPKRAWRVLDDLRTLVGNWRY